MATKNNRFDVDWWIIQKRYIYLLIALLVLAVTASGASLYVWVYGNPFKHTFNGSNVPAGARFISFDGDVRVVRAATRENILARSDTQLYPGDIVQTQADGRARILLADGSTLVVRPNSVVTVRDNTSAENGQRTNVRVAVDRGQVNVRTEQQQEGSNNVVETPLTKNKLAAETGATFGVHDDNTEEVRVTSGLVDTTTRGGEKTTVRPGEYVALNQSGNVRSRERLLDVPMPSSPHDLEKIIANANGAANVPLRWQRPATGVPAHYRVEVATSPFFVAAGKVIERDQLDATQFSIGDLRPGAYFWRVCAVASSGQTSDWCDPQKFIIATGIGTGERVNVSGMTFEYVAGNIYLARGKSQAGNTIRINGRETIVASDGTFQLQIATTKGSPDIIVEAEDTQGNKTQTRVPITPDAAQR